MLKTAVKTHYFEFVLLFFYDQGMSFVEINYLQNKTLKYDIRIVTKSDRAESQLIYV